jgi:Fungal specific transcription factor domain
MTCTNSLHLLASEPDFHRNQIYFEKIHPAMPVIHRFRYLAAMDLAPNMRPPVCLRYAMWMHVASITPKYSALTDHFYARSRKYAEQDEMRGFGESMITIAHSQCWSLIANYEFKMMYFPRAWMSVGRATRLSQMMSLHRQDGSTMDVKQVLPPPRDWTEKEERRRTFWLAFCHDRYASSGTGWPMTFDERDVGFNMRSSTERQMLTTLRSRQTFLRLTRLSSVASRNKHYPSRRL